MRIAFILITFAAFIALPFADIGGLSPLTTVAMLPALFFWACAALIALTVELVRHA